MCDHHADWYNGELCGIVCGDAGRPQQIAEDQPAQCQTCGKWLVATSKLDIAVFDTREEATRGTADDAPEGPVGLGGA